MFGIFYLPVLIFIAAAILAFFYFSAKRSWHIPGKQHATLDRVGMVTNVILLILYFPLSMIGSFSAMVSEGYIYGTEAQLFLCDLIAMFGFCTPIAAFGGLFVSVKLRKWGLSTKSFLWQFSGIAYFVFILALMAVLDTL